MPSITHCGDATVVDIIQIQLRRIAANADALIASIDARRRKDRSAVGLCLQLELALNHLLVQEEPHRDRAIAAVNAVLEHIQPEGPLRLHDAGEGAPRTTRKRRP